MLKEYDDMKKEIKKFKYLNSQSNLTGVKSTDSKWFTHSEYFVLKVLTN